MKLIKGMVYLFIVVVLILLVTALFAPSFFIAKYQDKIIAEVQKATGRNVSIGDISAHILPNPSIKLSDVKIPSVEGAQFKNFVETDSLHVNLELWPLFSRTVEIRSLDLNGARIFAEKLADGSNNWTFPKAQQQNDTAGANSSSTESSGVNIVLRQGSLQNTQIIYLDHKTGMQQAANNINFDLQMDSLQGPFNATGSLNWNNIPMNIALAAGDLSNDSVTIKGGIAVADAHKLDLDTAIQLASAKKDFQGNIMFNSPDIQALANVFNAGSSVPKTSLSASSPIAGNMENINLENLSLKFLNTNITGAVNVMLQGDRPKVTTKFTGDQLSIDALLAAMPKEKAKAKPKPQGTSPKPQDAVSKNLSPIDLDLDATLKTLVYNNQNINNIVAKATLVNDILAINALNINDFFGGRISLSGKTDIKNPQAAGINFDVAHPDIARLLAVSGSSADIPEGIKNIALKGKLGLAPSRFNVKDVTGNIGSSNLKNGQALIDISGNVPYIETTTNWGTLDLTSMTKGKASKPAASSTQTSDAQASSKSIDFSPLGLLNGRFAVKADQVKYAPHILTNMALQASLQNKLLTVDNISFNAYKGTISTTAVVDASKQAANIKINPKISNLSIGEAAKHITKVKLPTGSLNMQAALTTLGKSSAEFMQNLNGNGNLTVGNISPTSANDQDFLNILQKLNSAVKGGGSLLNLEAGFNAVNGVINFDPATAKGIISANAKGYLDLPKQYVDIRGNMQLLNDGIAKFVMATITKPQDKTYPFAFYGPLNNITTELPSDLQKAVDLYKGVSAKDLQSLAAGELGQKALKKLGLSDSILGLFGGASQNKDTSSSQTLDDVLKGLDSSGQPSTPKEAVVDQGKQKIQQETDKIIDQTLGQDNPLGGAAKEILNQKAGDLLNKLF